MTINRRTFLAAASSLVLSPAFAEEAPPALAAYERETGGRIGLYAENLASGTKLVWRAEERFVMCSTFKASLAACVLARVDRGEDRLDAMIAYGAADLLDYAPVAKQNLAAGAMPVSEMCKAIVELSDNACANLLLARIGGPAALTAFWRANGDTVSRLDHNEPELNRSPPGDPNDTTTPAAMAGNLRRFLLGDALSQGSREHLTEWMVGCKTGNNRLRGVPAEGLEDRRQDRQQRQGRLRRRRDRLAKGGRTGADLRLYAGRLAHAAAVRSHLCGNRTDGGPAIGLVPTGRASNLLLRNP
ncbi:beta-lactamase class A [Bradyrhizobium sp. URHC0002]